MKKPWHVAVKAGMDKLRDIDFKYNTDPARFHHKRPHCNLKWLRSRKIYWVCVLLKAPSTKLQHPEKHQISSSNPDLRESIMTADLVSTWLALKRSPGLFGAWSFSGAWCLEFGA
jgi:hypothetical protein